MALPSLTQQSLRTIITAHLHWQLRRVGFFMPADILETFYQPDVTTEKLLNTFMTCHEMSLSMLSAQATKNQIILTRLNEVKIKITTLQTQLDQPNATFYDALQTLDPLLKKTWQYIDNGIHEETKMLPRFLSEAVDNQLNVLFPDSAQKQALVEKLQTNLLLHLQYYQSIDKEFVALHVMNILYFLTQHVASADKILDCLTQQRAIFIHYQHHLDDILSMRLGNYYQRVRREAQLMVLLNGWLQKISPPQAKYDEFLLTRTKTQLLLAIHSHCDQNDFFMLLEINAFCQKNSELSAEQLFHKLALRCSTLRSDIKNNETILRPQFWSDRLHSHGKEVFKSFFYVELSEMVVTAGAELYSLSSFPFLPHNAIPAAKNIIKTLLTSLLILHGGSMSYLAVQSLSKIFLTQFNLLYSLVEKFSGDELTVLQNLSHAKILIHYLFFMGFVLVSAIIMDLDEDIMTYMMNALQNLPYFILNPVDYLYTAMAFFYQHAVEVLPMAHIIYGINELLQYGYQYLITPKFMQLQQQYSTYRGSLEILHVAGLFMSLILGYRLFQYAADLFASPQLTPVAIETAPVCNTTQALADLGLDSNATSIDIRHAWKRFAVNKHPDKSPETAAQFVKASNAYDCLVETGLVNRGKRAYQFKD